MPSPSPSIWSEVNTAVANLQVKKNRVVSDFKLNKLLYLMMLPVIAYYIIFHYIPMYGALIAFKDYSPMKGILGSDWVGLKHFHDFFNSYYFTRILKNTLVISLYSLIFEFPAPILLALLINEVRNKTFKRVAQTITYMPYFISLVVICGIITDFTNGDGIINRLFMLFGYDGQAMLQRPELFRPIYILSEIWQRIGWESIIYIAALMSIDKEQSTLRSLAFCRPSPLCSFCGWGICLMLVLRKSFCYTIRLRTIRRMLSPPSYTGKGYWNLAGVTARRLVYLTQL
jgi:ABC-type polysaccharide transport system permease subunit